MNTLLSGSAALVDSVGKAIKRSLARHDLQPVELSDGARQQLALVGRTVVADGQQDQAAGAAPGFGVSSAS
jgi:hypothetical protein